MNQQDILSIPSRLDKVKSTFESWRATREKGSRIPQSLWEEAVALYPEFTIGKISSALSLSYTKLKERVEKQAEKNSSNQNEALPGFIELDFSDLSMRDSSPSVSECVVEMEDGSGAKMRMCFRGKTDFDLLELGKAFWRRQS